MTTPGGPPARRAARSSDLMTDVDVILSPSAPGAAPKGLTSTGSSTFNRLWTLMGTPCVSVPGLADLAGLPLGMQVIGRFGSDRATLEAALFVESLLPRAELASRPQSTPPGCRCLKNALWRAGASAPHFTAHSGNFLEKIQVVYRTMVPPGTVWRCNMFVTLVGGRVC